MKKTLLSLCLVAAFSAAFAQKENPVTFGIRGGINLANFSHSHTYQDVSTSADMLTSFNAGAFADIKLSETISLQPALIFTGKGSNEKAGGLTVDTKTKVNANYLQVPVTFLHNQPIGKHILFFGLGPFAAYGIGGKAKGTIISRIEDSNTTTTVSYNEDVKFGSDESSLLKRWDYGVTIAAGFKLNNGLLLHVNYDFGLTNIRNDNKRYTGPGFSFSSHANTRVLGLSVGYVLK